MATPRERLHAALSGQPMDHFPVVVPYTGIFLRDHWRQVTDVPWWAVQAGDEALELQVQVQDDLHARLAIDWIEVGPCPSRAWRKRHRVELRGSQPFLVEESSGRADALAEPPPGGWQQVVSRTTVHRAEEVEAAVPIASAHTLLADGRFDLARALIHRFGQELFVLGSISTPFWQLYGHFGFCDLMMSLIERPALVEAMLERITLRAVEHLRAYAALGVDGIWIEDCYTSADLISLSHFRRFAVPYIRPLLAEIRRLGMKSIHYFCGDPWDRLEDLVALQPDALALEESKKSFTIDLARVDEAVAGRCCLFGNFDAIHLLEKGTTSALAAEVKRQTALGRRRGRLVHSLGSPVTPRTTTSRVRQWVEICRLAG